MKSANRLVQLIYCSAAKYSFQRDELLALLTKARKKNATLGVTGILLYSDGAFFQVLEGEPDNVESVFATISGDERHGQVTVIVSETIANRSFNDWKMGYVDISAEEGDTLLGASDFFSAGNSFAQLGPSRAKKLLGAFKQGRWRARIDDGDRAVPIVREPETARSLSPHVLPSAPGNRHYSYAFQPIIDASTSSVFSFEALIRGRHGESAGQVLSQVPPSEVHAFDEKSRVVAIEIAAGLGLATHLNLNLLPLSLESSSTAISSVLDAAARCNLEPHRIVLEVLEREFIRDFERFRAGVDAHRGSGLLFAIDDFGSGHAGLNLLADFQPDLIKLDMHLIRHIDSKGPRQAIVHGILRTCEDLGIDVIAEGVETIEEYRWLRQQGIRLFQGYLIAKPAFEHLEQSCIFPG